MDELSRLIKERDESAANLRLGKLRLIEYSFDIFQGNYTELIELITEYDKDILAWDLRNRYQLGILQKRISRLLFNFTASVMSLVDHTRIVYDESKRNNREIVGYEEMKVKYFVTDGTHQFLQKLRNYIIHKQIPDIGAGFSFSTESGNKQYLYLNKEELLDGFSWGPVAGSLLDSQESSIDIKPLISNYFQHVCEFHSWLRDAFFEAHKEDIAEIEDFGARLLPLQAELLQGHLLHSLQMCEQIGGDPFGHLAGIIDPAAYHIIDREKLSKSKMMDIFRYLEHQYSFEIVPEVKSKFLLLACKYDEGK